MTNDNDADDELFPWRSINRDFWLSDVRVVATLGPDRGAIVETPARLLCSEGRLETFNYRDGAHVGQLEYHFSFATHDEAEPYPSQSMEARIVIEGIHENSMRLEIRGDGWIGYDEIGRVEGHFYAAPVIVVDGEKTPENPEGLPNPRRGMERMPPQYLRATLAATEGLDDWDDD